MKNVVSGLKYITDRGSGHGDIKPGNFLINLVGKGNWKALIADFGLVKKSGGTPIYLALAGSVQIGYH